MTQGVTNITSTVSATILLILALPTAKLYDKDCCDSPEALYLNIQKQSSISVLRKRCSENKHQIYKRTPMPKCKKLKSHFGMGVLL